MPGALCCFTFLLDAEIAAEFINECDQHIGIELRRDSRDRLASDSQVAMHGWPLLSQ